MYFLQLSVPVFIGPSMLGIVSSSQLRSLLPCIVRPLLASLLPVFCGLPAWIPKASFRFSEQKIFGLKDILRFYTIFSKQSIFSLCTNHLPLNWKILNQLDAKLVARLSLWISLFYRRIHCSTYRSALLSLLYLEYAHFHIMVKSPKDKCPMSFSFLCQWL